jgi:hypothetical protein
VLLTRNGDGPVAALYLAVSLVSGFVAVALGVSLCRFLLDRPVPVFDPERDD